MNAAELAAQFDIPNVLRCEAGPGGLTRVVISTSAAEAELFLQGAHVTRWTPRGQMPVLFLSPKSVFSPDKAIRGGVPIVFPWFGSRADGKPGPDHGFARISEWTLESTRLRDDEKVEVALVLTPSAASRAWFPATFRLRFRVIVGAELAMELETFNEASEPFSFEAALHSYLAVGDVQRAAVAGLEGTLYIDKADGFKRKTQGSEPLRIAKETDEVHLNTGAVCSVHDPVRNRRVVVEKSGSRSTVVWNPWVEKTRAMSDLEPDSWKNLLCVEVANAADNAVHLAPGASHKMAARIRVEQLEPGK